MSRITVKQLIDGLYNIRIEKPTYKVGHDGSDGSCDGIGLIRGALFRGGATRIKDMKEPNQFARKTALYLRKVDSVKDGDILLKTISADDNSMPLPSKYRVGGIDYNGDLNNYVDVAIVLHSSPIEIMQMTKDGIKHTDSLDEWDYVCELPYILEEGEKVMSSAMISTDGKSVKMYAKPSFSCNEFVDIPNESIILVNDRRTTWSNVSFGDKSGFVLTKFLKDIEEPKATGFTEEDRKTLEEAYAILGRLLNK